MNKEVKIIRAKIKREEIVFICGVIEAYDDFAVTRTVDSKEGIIEFLASPDYYDDLKEVLENLSKETSLIIIK